METWEGGFEGVVLAAYFARGCFIDSFCLFHAFMCQGMFGFSVTIKMSKQTNFISQKMQS